jgi:SAM-dependent methyltransferase
MAQATAPAARLPPPPSALRQIALADLLTRWGCGEADVPRAERARITALGGFRVLDAGERRRTMLAMLSRLGSPLLCRDRHANLAAFERGWGENLERCREDGISVTALQPGYVKPLAVMRWGRCLVEPERPYLVHELTALTLDHVFRRHFGPLRHVYEAGCGTGRHLRALAERFPDKELIGLDWTEASVRLLALLAAHEERSITGIQFDMLSPPPAVHLEPGAGVFTVHALEQLGDGFRPFLEWLLRERPALVVHHEPIVEFYDPDVELDHLAIAYHHRRAWLSGYWPALAGLAAEGRIEILVARRLLYGDAYTEGSLIVWRPR